MNTKKLLVDGYGLAFMIECRRDSLGKECYVVTYSDKKLRFRMMASVLDFIEMNKGSLGYVE